MAGRTKTAEEVVLEEIKALSDEALECERRARELRHLEIPRAIQRGRDAGVTMRKMREVIRSWGKGGNQEEARPISEQMISIMLARYEKRDIAELRRDHSKTKRRRRSTGVKRGATL